MANIGELWIQSEQEVQLARQWTQKLARLVKLSIGNHARLTAAVSQITQSLYYYNQCVHVLFDVVDEERKQWLQITIQEAKNFIPNAEQSPQPTLSRQDLLKWLSHTQSLVTRFSIQAEEGQAIEIVLAKPFPSWTPYITEEDTHSWGEILTNEMPLSMLEEILQQNQELVQVLDALREKDKALEQKVEEIQSLQKNRDELVHAIIHDLRNPLATIRSSLSGLLYNDAKNLSPYQGAMIEFSFQAARNMTRLVDNILTIHKLEQISLPLHPEPLSVEKFINKVLAIQQPLAGKKSIQLTRRISSNLPSIHADIRLLERVVQNLLDNAIKFTPEGGKIIVAVKCLDGQPVIKNAETVESSEPYIAFSVKDTGSGISPELETHLFEKFSSGRQEESGNGLGLAFCRMAIQAHGGEIWAQNNPGKGATFTFILPLIPPVKELNHG